MNLFIYPKKKAKKRKEKEKESLGRRVMRIHSVWASWIPLSSSRVTLRNPIHRPPPPFAPLPNSATPPPKLVRERNQV